MRALCKGVPATRVKTVKFSERPSCEQLRRQLELVNQCFSYITTHEGDLDLQLTVTMNDAAQPAAAPAHVADAADTKTPQVNCDTALDALTTTEAKDVTPSHAQTKSAQQQQQANSRNEIMMEA